MLKDQTQSKTEMLKNIEGNKAQGNQQKEIQAAMEPNAQKQPLRVRWNYTRQIKKEKKRRQCAQANKCKKNMEEHKERQNKWRR